MVVYPTHSKSTQKTTKKEYSVDVPKKELNGTPLGQVKKYDYLGITIHEDLSFEGQVNKLIANVFNKVYLLGKLKSYVNSNTAVLLLKTYILPRIEYGDIFLLGL